MRRKHETNSFYCFLIGAGTEEEVAKFSCKIKVYSNDSDLSLTFEGPVISCEDIGLDNVDFVFSDAFVKKIKSVNCVLCDFEVFEQS